jgi:putative transposase
MYSYEDRVRAVKLYIKLGKRTAATIRQLGYPTKNALKSWHREFERSRDLPMDYVRLKPKYSDEQKKLAVDHYLDHGRCMAVTMKALGYPGRDTLATWIDDLHPDATKRLVGRAGSDPRPAGLKRVAVIELCTRRGRAKGVAEQIGVSRPTLYNWKNQLLGREVPASMKRPPDLPPESQREDQAPWNPLAHLQPSTKHLT